MPGPIVHLTVQQHLARLLERQEKGREIAGLLQQRPCSPYTGFGSMGPDFLFFSLTEYGTPLDEMANFIFGVYDALEPLIDFYETTIEPVVDTIEDAIAAVDQALFQGLFAQIQTTANLLSTTAVTAAGAVVTKSIDLFYPFCPKIQQNLFGSNPKQAGPENEWYWFDFLHDRRTGRFCSQMWKLAQGDDDLMRYCVGYASHIAVDVVGHPFVNAVVGGPYRMHWHRHKLVENWIDAYARNRYEDTSQTKRCLRLGEDDIYVPNAISGSYYSRLCEFPGKKLPQKLEQLLLKSMDLTYFDIPPIPHPPTLNTGDLDSTYRLWLKWFERTTSIGNARRPTPVPPPGSATIALVNDFVSGFPSFPGGAGAPSGGFSVLNIFAAILAFVKWLVDSLNYTLNWILTHTADILLLPLTEALGLTKWLLYQVQKGIYEIYDNLRFMLVIGGYLFPEPEDLTKSPWGQALLNTSFVHLTGGPAVSFVNYPRKQEIHGPFGPIEHHLEYPGTLREREHAQPAPETVPWRVPGSVHQRQFRLRSTNREVVRLHRAVWTDRSVHPLCRCQFVAHGATRQRDGLRSPAHCGADGTSAELQSGWRPGLRLEDVGGRRPEEYRDEQSSRRQVHRPGLHAVTTAPRTWFL